MTDKTKTDELDLTPPDFLDRSNPDVQRIVEAGRGLTLESRRAELALATSSRPVTRREPKAGSATAMAAKPKPEQTITKPAKVIDVPKPKVTAGKKSDAEMIALIKEHREAAGGTAGKTLKVLRGMDISCSQERFKKLYTSAS